MMAIGRLIAFLFIVGTWSAGAAQADTDARVALVIGNGAYSEVPRLANPRSDAEAIGQTLRDVGFTKVTVVSDLTHQGLFNALRTFASDSATADWSVLYYAGHGIEVDGKNYIVPVDAHLASDRDVEFEGIAMQTVYAAVGGARKLRLVILDACRNNPFLSRMSRSVGTRAISRGLAREQPEGNLYVVYSAQSGQVAADGEGGRNPFVTALLKNIPLPGIEINLLFRRVRADVDRATNGEQNPDFYGVLPGEELYFRPPPSSPAPSGDRLLAVEAAPQRPAVPQPEYSVKAAEPVQVAKAEQPPVAPRPPDPRIVALAVQTELRRVGCDPGPVNGQWGTQARIALLNFGQRTGFNVNVDTPDDSALRLLREQRGTICPPTVQAAPTPATVPKRASLEPNLPPAVQAPRRAPQPRPAQRAEKPAYVRPAPAPRTNCFTFNGERVCE